MMTKRVGILGAIAMLPAFAQVSSAPLPPAATPEMAPRWHAPIKGRVEHGDGSVTSGNWSGYAVTGSGFVAAEGSWIVPTMSCSSATQYAVFWVGIDGYSSSTVEQTGTEAVCSDGKPKYTAWYEFCCTEPIITITTMTIEPGDRISASIFYSASTEEFTVKIADERTGASFTKSAKVAGAERSSAEWIAEAPSSNIILPLADFGTVLFGKDNTSIASTCAAKDNTTTGAISAFPTIEEITMEKNSVMEAIPSSLSSDGTSFSVQWAAP
ncbi:MAG TPA: G1 family glutamic endopeptidase [Bryobacteraceae bacterium]|nr:G1 family glutamic endopeptidase [Bryobacteraceae bacterium]